MVTSKNGKTHIRIERRFPFSSALRRMAVICSSSTTTDSSFVTVKGAPEALHPFFGHRAPSWYVSTYQEYARKGSRILALGYKAIKWSSSNELKEMDRSHVEHNLEFVGFLVFHCPLKKDSKEAVLSLINSSHKVFVVLFCYCVKKNFYAFA